MEWLWWWGAALLLIAIEVLSLNLVLLMFAGGAVAAGIAAAMGASLELQLLLLAVVSALLLVSLRPWLLRYLRERVPLVETNSAAQVGRLALVVDDVDARGGRVKLSGEVWSARSAHAGARYDAGSEVRVVAIDGATAVIDHASVAAEPQDAPPPRRPVRPVRRSTSPAQPHRPEDSA